jgi:hypothetical protein
MAVPLRAGVAVHVELGTEFAAVIVKVFSLRPKRSLSSADRVPRLAAPRPVPGDPKGPRRNTFKGSGSRRCTAIPIGGEANGPAASSSRRRRLRLLPSGRDGRRPAGVSVLSLPQCRRRRNDVSYSVLERRNAARRVDVFRDLRDRRGVLSRAAGADPPSTRSPSPIVSYMHRTMTKVR